MSANTVSVSSSIDVVSLSAIENAVSVVFGDRPKALEDGSQGDHTVAYALYQKWLVKSIEESVASCGGDYSSPAWIGLFVEKMQGKLTEEIDFLTEFELDASANAALKYNFNKFLTAALNLKNDYINDADIKNLLAYKERVNRDTQVPEEFVGTYGGNLIVYKQEQSAFLEKLIMQRKIALGAKVAESAAVAFLQIKNASPMVSFKQVPGRAVDKGQGGRINGALGALSKYISGDLNSLAPDEPGEIAQQQPVARAEGKRKINQPQLFGNVVTGNDPRYNQDAGKNQDIANKLAGHIITLLDFKKLSDTELNQVHVQMKDNKKLLSSRFRTNDKNVLHFTIASLLTTIFQTFPEIEKDETIKKLTIQAVVDGLLRPEYAGKNNAKWDSNDITPTDVSKILGLLGMSNSETNAATPKKPQLTMPYEQYPALVKATNKFKNLISQRRALGGPNSPRRPQEIIGKSPQDNKKSRLSLGDTPDPAHGTNALPQTTLDFMRSRSPFIRFSPYNRNVSSTPPPKQPFTPPPQPPKGGGPGFGGSG